MTEAPAPVNPIVMRAAFRHSAVMLYRVTLASVFLLLAGCAPVVTFYQPGRSFAQLEADSLDCEIAALRDVPVANATVQDPPEFVAPRKICDSDGFCRTLPGTYIPGEIRTIDANKPLRRRVVRQCMAERGYTLQEIPLCPATATVSAEQSQILPRLTEASCAIRTDKGGFVVATQP